MRTNFHKQSPCTSGCGKWRPQAGLIAITLLALQSPLAQALTIARPNFGVPEFAEPGGTIRVEVKHAAGLDAGLWSAVLMNDLRTWTAAVESAEFGTFVDNNTVSGYRLTVRLPTDIPPEVHKLVISHPAGGSAVNHNAVGVVTSFETDFYILHYADPQAESATATDPVTGMYGTHGSLQEIGWHAPAIRLANPRFLFDTGDELDNRFGNATTYGQHRDAMCAMGVPVLATRGNNDSTISATVWRSIFGVESYSITLGSFYVCQKDYLEHNFSTWFQNDYAASFANPAIKYRLFGQHYNSGGATWLPPAGQYPNLMLVGHGHVNATLQSSPYPVLETQQACNKCAVGYFNFHRSAAGWSCTSIGSQWFQMMSSGSTAKLRCQYATANDGTATTNQAAITNNLAANFHDGRVRFLMQNAALGYQVTGGQILTTYSYNNDANRAVLVKVDIPSGGNAAVAIVKVDADDDGMPDAWETAWFGSTGHPQGAADSDWDHDGQSNLHEFLAGTNPTDPSSVFRITSVAPGVGGTLVLQWPSVSGRTYRVQYAGDLGSAFQDTSDSALAGTGGTLTKTVAIGAGARGFYRVRIVP